MPQCRQKLQAEKLGPYPRSACLKCGWKVTKGNIKEMCTDPDYNGGTVDYVQELDRWVANICKHTGLMMTNETHKPLILMYTLMAMHKGEEVTQEDVHDAWALWTMYMRELPGHENMVPYSELTDRVKALDKIDMWAIQETAKACA